MAAVVSRGRGRRTINEINMVPFIDVMLVLLIIFMVTAPLIAPSMINLPSVGKAASQPDQVIQIVIGKDEALQLKLKDKTTKEPFELAGKLVYQKAFRKGLAWIPAGHILRMSPPIVMPNEVAHKAMDIIEEALGETERELLG